jgi:hypothetical protein
MYELISSPRLAGSRGRRFSPQIALDQRRQFCEIYAAISPLSEGAAGMRLRLKLQLSHRNWAATALLSLATFLGLATMAGCASDQVAPKTASSADPLAAQARRFRNSDGDRVGTGLTSRTRDVEKDLGFR